MCLVYLVVLLLCRCEEKSPQSASKYPYIEQVISACLDENHFEIKTYVYFGLADIRYFERTFSYKRSDCLIADSVKSRKEVEYQKAKKFIENYNKIIMSNK